MNPKAVNVKYKPPYKLLVEFESKELKTFDLQAYLPYPAYELLRDETFCSGAKVVNGIVLWDEETDMDPDRLYLESKPLIAVNVENTDNRLNG